MLLLIFVDTQCVLIHTISIDGIYHVDPKTKSTISSDYIGSNIQFNDSVLKMLQVSSVVTHSHCRRNRLKTRERERD